MKELKEMELFDELLKTPENELVKKAIADGRHAIAYNCYMTPSPILECGNLFPVRLRATQVESTEDGNFYLGTWLCSYSRSVVQALINNDYAFADGILGILSCVQMQRAIQHEGLLGLDKKKDPFFYEIVDMPRKKFDASTARTVEQMRAIGDQLHDMFGTDMSDDAMRETIRKHNEFNALMRSIGDLRKEEKPKITGAEWHRVMAASLVAPHDLLIEPLKALKAALDKRTPDKAREPRLMIVGNVIDDPAYIDLVESEGCHVVADRFCFGSLPGLEDIEEEGDPCENIVRHYIEGTQCPRMMEESLERFDYLKGLIDEYKVDGVIYETVKFCDLWGYEVLVNYKRLQEAGIPAARIEREYKLSGEGQFSTRVQAFVESLKAKDLY